MLLEFHRWLYRRKLDADRMHDSAVISIWKVKRSSLLNGLKVCRSVRFILYRLCVDLSIKRFIWPNATVSDCNAGTHEFFRVSPDKTRIFPLAGLTVDVRYNKTFFFFFFYLFIHFVFGFLIVWKRSWSSKWVWVCLFSFIPRIPRIPFHFTECAHQCESWRWPLFPCLSVSQSARRFIHINHYNTKRCAVTSSSCVAAQVSTSSSSSSLSSLS